MKYDLAIVITCDRNRSLAPALTSLLPVSSLKIAEIIVVLYDLDERALGNASTIVNHCLNIKGQLFNKSLGINLGVQHSNAHSIFLLDADTSVSLATLQAGLNAVNKGKSYATIRKVHSLQFPPTTSQQQRVCSLAFPDSSKHNITIFRQYDDGSRSGPGLTFVSRADFLAVGGMNSELCGWGWEDIDLLVRLQKKLGLKRRYVGSAVHYASDRPYSRSEMRTKYETERQNMYKAFLRYQRLDFNGTYETDIFEEESNRIIVETIKPRS
jgi:predicted glycosyltransferase involved in capsule biosynthesis